VELLCKLSSTKVSCICSGEGDANSAVQLVEYNGLVSSGLFTVNIRLGLP